MIPVSNIYYMLSYAFKILREAGYRKLASEKYENAADLCAAILERGISSLLRQGLGREYITRTETLTAPKGKIDIADSIKTFSIIKRQLVCDYDDFSVNMPYNCILKTTIRLLLSAEIATSRKKSLRKLLVYFNEVDETDLNNVDWNIRFDRGNRTYRMLMAVCRFVYKGLIQRDEDGNMQIMHFLDEQRMCRLYEKFILEYYRQEHPEISASASQIAWQLDDGVDSLLPVMQTDIYLSDAEGKRVLIIDAKYYEHTIQYQFDSHTLHSGNLYQIFTYVKNKEAELHSSEHEVAGMLLYAKTDEQLVPDNRYMMSGNRIEVRTLDLSCDFDEIRAQLDGIVQSFFG